MKVVYPGTFDPFTCGHLDLVRRGLLLFGRLTVAVAASPVKDPLFSLDERVALIRQSVRGLKGVRVAAFRGTLVGFMRSHGARVVMRGLRTLSDCDYEMQLALFNRRLSPGVETVFVVASPEYSAVSSGLVREVARLDEDVSDLVPRPVLAALKKRLGGRGGQ
jgi:pantetheine-phosphate adenylyltransferase